MAELEWYSLRNRSFPACLFDISHLSQRKNVNPGVSPKMRDCSLYWAVREPETPSAATAGFGSHPVRGKDSFTFLAVFGLNGVSWVGGFHRMTHVVVIGAGPARHHSTPSDSCKRPFHTGPATTDGKTSIFWAKAAFSKALKTSLLTGISRLGLPPSSCEIQQTKVQESNRKWTFCSLYAHKGTQPGKHECCPGTISGQGLYLMVSETFKKDIL